MNEYNYGGAQFPYKRNGHSGLDRLENKSALSNPYNYSKNSSKLSKFDRLNSSHIVTTGDEKDITPLRSESIKTELHREAILEGVKKSGRLKTDESEKLKRMDLSFDCAYLEKQKGLQEQKKRVPAIQHTRAMSHTRAGRNIPNTGKDYLNMSKGTDESVIEPLRKKIYPRLQSKRTSAQVEKSFTNNFMDTTLPAILINGVERTHKEKSINARATATNEFQALDSPSTRPRNKKEGIIKKLMQPIARVTGPRPENSNGRRNRTKQESSLSPNHENMHDGYSFTQNLRSTSSLAGNNLPLSPPKEKEHNTMNHSFLEGVSSSMNTKGQLSNTISIDYAFEKVNELTNKNNLARYDLLKIQESALELKMRLNARRTQLGRPMKEMNRTNQTVIEELNSYNNLFVMDGEL